MFLQVCVGPQCGGGVVSQHALQVVSQHVLQQVSRGVVSQHALQVSRPTPKGEVEGDLARRVSRPTPKEEVEGDLAGGDLQAHTQGVPAAEGCLQRGGGCVETPMLATGVGGMHPTGMHSCS